MRKEWCINTGSKCDALRGKWEENEGRSWRNPGFGQAGSHPVVCLNWIADELSPNLGDGKDQAAAA
jgi:hypothetical protein